jgi:predicted nucleic acid-binding protein
LGSGELEAISLAVELNATLVVLDDRAARSQAKRLGLHMIGTLGILVASKRHGYITQLRPELDNLIAHGFFLSDNLVQQVLFDVGESP